MNRIEKIMRIKTVTKMLMDDVLQNWDNYTHDKQYAYGLLGKMLLEKIVINIERYRNIQCDSKKSIASRLKSANVHLIKEAQNILFLLNITEWPVGFEKEWTETHELELCRDIVLVANGCAATFLQQLAFEFASERK